MYFFSMFVTQTQTSVCSRLYIQLLTLILIVLKPFKYLEIVITTVYISTPFHAYTLLPLIHSVWPFEADLSLAVKRLIHF